MLNILNKKQKLSKKKTNVYTGFEFNLYLSNKILTKQWQESVYYYNNIYNKALSNSNKITECLIKMLFNSILLKKDNKEIINKKNNNNTDNTINNNQENQNKRRRKISKEQLEKQMRIKMIIAKRKWKKLRNRKRIKIRRMYISKPEIKHTNKKAIITVYSNNPRENSYLFKIKKFYKNLTILKSRLKYPFLLTLWIYGFNNKIVIRKIKKIERKIRILLRKMPSSYRLKKLNNKLIQLKRLEKIFFVIERILYYSKLLLIERNKLKILFSLKNKYLINLLKNIYQKEIEIDIINHKSKVLNSEMLSSYLLRVIRRKYKWARWFYKYWNRWIVPGRLIKNVANQTRKKIRQDLKKTYLKKSVLKDLNLITIVGLRLKVSGRLTRRRIASRSISRIFQKGSFKNTNLYTTVTNNLGDNMYYSKSKNKTRNGSFGIKCWINNY